MTGDEALELPAELERHFSDTGYKRPGEDLAPPRERFGATAITRTQTPAPVPAPPLVPEPVQVASPAPTGQGEAFEVPGRPKALEAPPGSSAQTPAGLRLPGRDMGSCHQLLPRLRTRHLELLVKNQYEDETYGETVVRAVAATREELVEHFQAGTAELGGGFGLETKKKRNLKKSPTKEQSLSISKANAVALRALLDECGLGERYTPLIEKALELAFAKP